MKVPIAIAAALALAACQDQPPAPSAADEPQDAAAGNGAAEAPPAAVPPGEPTPPEAPAPGPAAGSPWSPGGYRLIGTEPFWGGTVTDREIVYSTPDNQEGERVAVTVSRGAAQEVYSGSLDGEPFVLTLTRGPCSDGMSDNVHVFTAALQVRGETRQGCANPQS